MVWLVFMIGALNLCLGYAMAVHLGYGPSHSDEAWEEFSDPTLEIDEENIEVEAIERECNTS